MDSPDLLDEEVPQAAGHGSQTAAKGRPTPKRNEAERRPKSPFDTGAPGGRTTGGKTAGPKLSKPNRKAANARQRSQQRASRDAAMARMRRGDQSAMPARERGPVKQLARDYVDSRRVLLSEYVLFGLVALILVMFLMGRSSHGSNALNSGAVLLIELAILVVVGIEGLFHGMRVTRMARQRFPGEPARGLVWYVTKRSIRLRGTRIPPVRDSVVRGGRI